VLSPLSSRGAKHTKVNGVIMHNEKTIDLLSIHHTGLSHEISEEMTKRFYLAITQGRIWCLYLLADEAWMIHEEKKKKSLIPLKETYIVESNLPLQIINTLEENNITLWGHLSNKTYDDLISISRLGPEKIKLIIQELKRQIRLRQCD
jgi:hypothetical protein